MSVYSNKQAQVEALLFNKALTKISAKYSNYNNVFLAEYIAELPENIRINKYAIQLEEGKQPLLGPIYSLRPVEFETFKTYIKINLANGFIRPSKSLARTLILSDRNLNRSLCFCMDYWSLNNLIIKNQDLLFLIGESLN